MSRKHHGFRPIVGVNRHLQENSQNLGPVELSRAREQETQTQLKRLRDLQAKDPGGFEAGPGARKQATMNNENVLAELMHAVRYCALSHITM